ncbi:MAG: Mut7-C ubiquitin/RNAse domain-containing protein [Deltaproteobacteria bacterium]|nr:Mut7-C ubiquitin/RNAse domain-containing protein [Deltaproteobacteria bacterium]
MAKAMFRFYEELNDFLPTGKRKTDFEAAFKGKRSIKDMIEALGVPHTEIDLILVNGKSVDFQYILKDGDRVSVYPVFETLDIEGVTHLREIPLRKIRFIVDNHLGDIVKYLRALGFDVWRDASLSPRDIIAISKKENRIILTKSKSLLKFKEVTHGLYIYPGATEDQVKRILDFLDLKGRVKPFSRCLLCNNLLKPIAREEIADRIPPKTKAHCDAYTHCEYCDKVYWKGTHFMHMNKVIERILG